MKGYREAAVVAANLLRNSTCDDAAEAWARAAKKTFRSSRSLQDKGCPKGAFIGLCNRGLIVDVPGVPAARMTKNGEYAVQATEVLRENKFLVSQPDLLWKKIAGNTKSHNHQMDVVIGLWEANLIK